MTLSATAQDIDHLEDLIQGIRIAMMTTVCKDGSLTSRPMATLEPPIDGRLWFFTKADSAKVGEVEEEGQVNVSYVNVRDSIYVSLSGQATLVQDRQQIEKLWTDDLKAWFPEGLNDPELVLLRVDIEKWAYWESKSEAVLGHYGTLRDKPAPLFPDVSEFQRIDLSGIWVSQDVGTARTRNDIPFLGPSTEV